MPAIYLADFTGNGTAENPYMARGMGEGASIFDLRPDSTGVADPCLLGLPLRDDGPGRIYLGTDLDEPLSNASRGVLQGRLALTLVAGTLREALHEIGVVHAREDGSRWRPLRPARGKIELILGGEPVVQVPVIQGGAPLTAEHLLQVGRITHASGGFFIVAAFGREFLVSAQGSWLAIPRGGADVSDNFNRADENPLSGGGNWTSPAPSSVGLVALKVVTNEVQSTNKNAEGNGLYTGGAAPADNQYAQIALVQGVDRPLGPSIRGSASAKTLYYCNGHFSSGSWRGPDLSKYVNGTATSLNQTTNVAATGTTWKIDAVGTTLTTYVDGVSKATASDSAIASGRVGIMGGGNGNETLRSDNFQGSGPATSTFTYVGTGGITFGGVATTLVNHIKAYLASGGITFGGSAATMLGKLKGAYVGSGGFIVGGEAATFIQHLKTYVASGGLVFGGAAITESIHPAQLWTEQDLIQALHDGGWGG